MQGLPVNLQLASGSSAITTNATPGTLNTFTVITAPGPDSRIRVWGATFVRLAGDAGRIEIHVRQNGGNFIINAGLGADGNGFATWIPGGIVVAENTALAISDRASIASQRYYPSVFYTVEDV